MNDDEIRERANGLWAPREPLEVLREFLQGHVADFDENEIEHYARRMAKSFPATIEKQIDALSAVLQSTPEDPRFFTNLVCWDANKNLFTDDEDAHKVWLERLLANLRAWTT